VLRARQTLPSPHLILALGARVNWRRATNRDSSAPGGITGASRSNYILWCILLSSMSDGMVSPPSFLGWSIAMKTLVSTLIALSVLAGIAGSASAFDAKTFYEEQGRQSQ
jgi:hypothetical protein